MLSYVFLFSAQKRMSVCNVTCMHYDQSIKIYGQLSKQSALEYTTFMMQIKFIFCSQKIEGIFGHE